MRAGSCICLHAGSLPKNAAERQPRFGTKLVPKNFRKKLYVRQNRGRPTPAKKDGYLLGSYRIATAPEPSSSRLTSFKSIGFDNPANNVGPWPAILGCTTNSYSSINPSSANASGSFTPPVSSPLPGSRLSC